MKIKFRTVLLVFLFIKLCILFTVLQETIESLNSNDHPLLFGTNDIYLFDLMLASISGLSMLISGFLIILFAIGHTRIRKPYVIVAFVINLVFVVPFFFSGVYLIFQTKGLELTPEISKSFEIILNFADEYNNASNIFTTVKPKSLKKAKTGGSSTSKPSVLSPVDPDLLNHFEVVEHVQKRYCCCGLNGAEDYGFDNATTAMKMSIPFTSKLNIQCPHNSLFKNSTCGDSHSRGCESRLKTVYPTRILIYSCIGSVFSVVFALVSPFIYSQFELDRRRARANYIRDWRHSLEVHVNDHRMWNLRKRSKHESPEQSIKSKKSLISPSTTSNQTRSSISKESLKKGDKSN
ncbi:unnamed protein product [Caenorhabditis brenneri]